MNTMHWILASILASILVWATPATAQHVAQGYRLLTDPQVTGGHLVAARPGTGSAFDLLKQAFREVAGFFQGKPMALGGFVDASDRRAEVVFKAALGGSPVGGVAYAIVAGGTGTAGFVFDSPQTIRQSLPRLVQLAGGSAGPAPALNWRDVPFPDGSGWMRLPEGWVITFANKGMASAHGPHGAIERGVWGQGYTRAAMAQYMAHFPGMPPPTFVADPIDLSTVFQAHFAHIRTLMQQQGVPPRNLIRILEVAPAPLVPGYSQAALLDFEYEEAGVRYRAIQYFMLGNVSMDGSYVFYLTFIGSRSESFHQNLPVLIEIWASARTAKHVIDERIRDTMRNLRQAGEIYNQTMQNRARAQQRMHDKWTEVFRGTRIVEDTLTGDRRTVDLAYSREIVQRLNELEGPGRYREIPLWQLNQ